nr:MFS transporter [Novosphingobium sp. PhB165]
MYGMMASMLGTIVPTLGLSTSELSWLAQAHGVGLATTSVWAGAFMDRGGKKTGIASGLIASAAGLILLTHPVGLVPAMIAMALLGVGGSLVIVGANALVNYISTDNKASALNVLKLFIGLGGMATPLVACNARLCHLARKRYIPCADYHSAMTNGASGMTKGILSDGVHPNPAGYAIMEPSACAAIQSALDRRR